MNVYKLLFSLGYLLLVGVNGFSANLANPAVLIPQGRIAFGASYDLGGYSLTNREVPAMFNRIQGRFSLAPFSFLNIGLDAGSTQIEIASDTTRNDTFATFHGKFGVSGGGHLKLGTPFFFNNTVSGVCLIQGSYFSSQNEAGTIYGGFDGASALGLQFHLPSFGYVTAGSTVYLIKGKSKSYTGAEGIYSNVNNVRGWLAFDYFPQEKMGAKNLLYFSLELSVSPRVAINKRAPVQEMGISISIGSISRRLWGVENDVEWKP